MQALLHASEATTTQRSHLKAVFDSTLGISFLGTPHQGSLKASWGAMLASILGYVKQDNKAIVSTLEKEAPHLNELQKRFLNLLEGRKQIGEAIELTCFFEELPLPLFGTIVPDQSATIPGYEAIGIPADHSDMTKFGGDDSPGYRRVLGEVQRWIVQNQAKKMNGSGVKEDGKGKVERGMESPGSINHYGNISNGGVGLYGRQSFQNSGVTNIGGVHTVHHGVKNEE